MLVQTHDSLSNINAEEWNALNIEDNPFLRYEFFAALEHSQCIGDQSGWIPQYITAQDNNKLVGALPLFIKHHSYGEYIFDWAWANAYEHHGLAYYPKLVVAVPFTPVNGHRILCHPQANNVTDIQNKLIESMLVLGRELDVSSIHCLFTTREENHVLSQHNFIERIGYQFHWENNNYSNFDHYLSQMASRHRKKIKRERQRIREQNIQLNMLPAKDVDENTWRRFYAFYQSTCYHKGGTPYLNFAFFKQIAKNLPDHTLLATAHHEGQLVATAFFMHNQRTLYGRYWGCAQEFHSLHFETCYYTPIEYCIEHQFDTLEAGAQGEHKLSRGLLPTTIHSSHWIAHPGFREAIANYLSQEKEHTLQYQSVLSEHSPFKLDLSLIDKAKTP